MQRHQFLLRSEAVGSSSSFDYYWNTELAPFIEKHQSIPIIIRELGYDQRKNTPTWLAETLSLIAEQHPEIIGVSFFSENMDGQYEFHRDKATSGALLEELDKGYFGDSR